MGPEPRREWRLPLTNPLSDLRLENADNRRERRLREGEEALLLDAADKSRNHLMRPIIELALETALRRSELLRIEGRHIDLQRRLLTIPEAKNGYARTIPLTAKALRTLKHVAINDGALFTVSPNAVRLAWERITKRAGLVDLHFHDLRHEAVSRLFEKGLTVPEVASISGHRQIQMLMRYAHTSHDRLYRNINRT